MDINWYFNYYPSSQCCIVDITYFYFSFQVSHHPPMSAGHAENEHFIYDITSKVKTKFLGNSVEIYPMGR